MTDARLLAESLVGQTLATPARANPNTVMRVDGANVIVGTADSPAGEPVALAQLQRGVDLLFEHGEIRIEPETFDGYRRSSAIGAILASLAGTEVTGPPTSIRLVGASPLRDGLTRACELVAEPRSAPDVTTEDLLYALMANELPQAIETMLGDPTDLKIRGSAGQGRWVEAPWVAVFDPLVTESAQQGHFVTFAFDAQGTGVWLSLIQGVTGRDREAVAAHGARLGGFLPDSAVTGLRRGSIDLNGDQATTKAAETASVVAKFFPADAIPHDAELALELRRFLDLYEMATAGLDAEEIGTDISAPPEAQSGPESRQYRWHLRAEGRNRSLVKEAKRIQGSACCVCGRDYGEEYGELGKRCIDAHHLTPFAQLDSRPRQLDPRTDFAIVCCNCHRMLHSETPPLLPDELRSVFGR